MQSVVGVAMVPEAILEKLEPMPTRRKKIFIPHFQKKLLKQQTAT